MAISTDPTTARSVPESAYGFGPPVAPEPRRLYRRPDGRLVAGVASRLAEHLGLSPLLLRAAFALLVAAGGAGVLLYAAFWAVVPQRPLDPAATRTAGSSSTSGSDPGQLVALAALALGAVLLAGVFGPSAANVVVWPVVVGGVGVALLWRQADVAQRGRWLAVPGRYGTPIEVVLVGDCPLDERLTSAVQAAREAMVNAVKHPGADSIAVYAEAELDQVTVFVRDRGSGFLPASVDADRAGIRESVVGRMERHGGTAVIHSSPGNGTEIELSLPLHPAGSAR